MYLNGNPQTTTSAPLLLKVQARVLFFFYNSCRPLIFRRVYLPICCWLRRESRDTCDFNLDCPPRTSGVGQVLAVPLAEQEVVGDGIFEQTLDHVSGE